MSNGNGHRWSKFWWSDWQNDPALRICGLAAQGLWMRLLCLMHEAECVGHLLINGRQPTNRQIASLVGAREKQIAQLMGELRDAGVYSVTNDGVIFCRRMVKDAAASEAGREHVEKRWQAQDPNRDPNRGATRKPNGEATSRPSRDPITRSLEAEEEEERGVPPYPYGTPPSAGTPPAPRNGQNPRALAKNPRALGTNPRALGTNPRANGAHPPFKNGFLELVASEGIGLDESDEPDEDGLDPVARFLANHGLRYGPQ